MLTRRDRQPLEHAVEVVDDAGVVAIDVHFGLLRLDFEPQRGAWIHPVVMVGIGRRIAPRSVVAVPRIGEPERVVEPRVVAAADVNHRSDGPNDVDGSRAAPLGVGVCWSCQ